MRTPSAISSYLLIVPLALSSWACSSSSPDGGRDSSSDGVGSTTDGQGGGNQGSSNTTVPGLTGGIIPGGTAENPCEAEDAPDDCELVASGPACGDGEINLDPPEACDDGNSLPGDGCSGTCVVEPYNICETPGQPCVSTIICGDGEIGPGEACDDGNATAGDGCSDRCNLVETGYVCRDAGTPCTRVFLCGDGVTDPNEGCDDGNLLDADGCSARCRLETGFKCEGDPIVCTPTTCGDNIREGAESCDDGNQDPFDGCSATCQAEPVCPTGEACSSSCGDGIMFAGEECDDGNLRDGDGCSSSCVQEEGYNCQPPEACTGDDCTLTLPIIFRDFSEDHTDFGVSCGTIERNVPQALLSADGKPVLSAASYDDACINTTASFADWYTDQAVNHQVTGTIVLYPDGNGGYVNRYGANGEKYLAPVTANERRAGDTLEDCEDSCENWAINSQEMFAGQPQLRCTENEHCQTETQRVRTIRDTTLNQANNALTQAQNQPDPDPDEIAELEAAVEEAEALLAEAEEAVQICLDECQGEVDERVAICTPECAPCGGGEGYCIGVEILELDGNPLFFPVDDVTGPTADMDTAQIPQELYLGGWRDEPGGALHNFYFTSEIAYWFEYTDGMTAELSFIGDDDMWVFVNGRLAVDLGGLHVPTEGRFTLNANGTIDQIHGTDDTADENEPDTSTVAEFGLEPGNVYEVKVFQAERKKTGSTYKLTLSGFNAGPSDCLTDCGDGEIGPGELCDDGPTGNTGEYNQCTPQCTPGPRCGDAVVQDQFGEQCDNGVNDGAYGGCAPTCQAGPHCGDSVVQSEFEQCDDGTNDGGYGECSAGCVLGPYCGDGNISLEFEECDDGGNENGDGCSAACKREISIPK